MNFFSCKRISFVLTTLLILTHLLTFDVSAHPGKTDSRGGHFNREEGTYHYHHGYSAHSHYDMNGDGIVDCPYNFDDQTNHDSNNTNYSYKTNNSKYQTSSKSSYTSSDTNTTNTTSTKKKTITVGDVIGKFFIFILTTLHILYIIHIVFSLIIILINFFLGKFTQLDEIKFNSKICIIIYWIIVAIVTVINIIFIIKI